MHPPPMLTGSRADTRPLVACKRCGSPTTDLSGVRIGSGYFCRWCWTAKRKGEASKAARVSP